MPTFCMPKSVWTGAEVPSTSWKSGKNGMYNHNLKNFISRAGIGTQMTSRRQENTAVPCSKRQRTAVTAVAEDPCTQPLMGASPSWVHQTERRPGQTGQACVATRNFFRAGKCHNVIYNDYIRLATGSAPEGGDSLGIQLAKTIRIPSLQGNRLHTVL